MKTILEDRFLYIFNLYKNDIYRFINSYTKNKYDTDDVSQKVFIKLYKNSKILNEDEIIIKKWLLKVSLNECKSLFLSSWKKKNVFYGDEFEFVGETSDINNFEFVNNSEMLKKIFRLNKNERIIIYLYYYESLKIKEIKKIIHLSKTNIQTILYRARKKLKQMIMEENNER